MCWSQQSSMIHNKITEFYTTAAESSPNLFSIVLQPCLNVPVYQGNVHKDLIIRLRLQSWTDWHTVFEAHLVGGVRSAFVFLLATFARFDCIALRKGPQRFWLHHCNCCCVLMLSCAETHLGEVGATRPPLFNDRWCLRCHECVHWLEQTVSSTEMSLP